MLRMVLSTDWIAVRDEILSRIAGDVAAEKGNRVYMVPELISHDTERRLCLAAGDTASRFAEVLSFTRLGRRVADLSGGAAQECLDNGGRIVVMASAARQLVGRLKAYAAVETKPEFLAELVDAVDEFKRCRIAPLDLQRASEMTEGSLAQRLGELSLLMTAYDSLCAQGKRDPRDRESLLLEQLEDSDFASRHVFYIDGFPDYTRQHMAILEHLIQVSPMVTVGINCDRVGSKKMAFEKAGDTASELVRIAKRHGVEVKIDVLPGRNGNIARLCGGLFQGELPVIEDGSLQVVRAQSVHEEVLETAERIMSLVRDGARYRDIGVVLGDPGGYEMAVDLLFHRCGIPMYRAGKEDILQKTAISTVLAALDAALGGLEQKDVLKYLKSILSPLDQDLCDRVENYAVLWGIQGKGWLIPWNKHPDGLNEGWNEDAQQELAELEEARKMALTPLAALKEKFDAATNLGQQIVALYEFLEEIRLAEKLDTLARELDEAGDNRSAQILGQLWEILLSALEQLYDALGQTAWESDNFVRLLKLLLSRYDVGTIPPVLDAVTVGPVSAQRCQQVKHLFVLGAAEGALPGYGGSKGLLSDQERVELRNLGVPLTGGAMEGIQAEFAEIYGVFCGAMESVTVSCAGGQPSYIYHRLVKMAGGEEKAQPNLGAAICDKEEAAAYLVRWHEGESAIRLGLAAEYAEAQRKTRYELGCISRENVDALYGKKLNLSASQIDRQAECRMSYFLKYGLRAKERKEATVDPAEFGTYVHEVLEKTAARVMDMGGFHGVSLEQTMDIAMGYADDYAQEHFGQLESQRIGYLFRRNRRELEMVVAELWQELKSARFQPNDFEMLFGQGGKMEAIQIENSAMPASLRGFVDRVDIWKEDGRNYFRVVDYKTGKKDFDYCDVFNGVGLQMLLYLFALEQGGYGTAAGVQYFPARVPLLNADGKLTEEEAQALRLKEWKRKGLLLKDEDVLDAMDPDGWQRLCASKKKDGSVVGDLADREQLRLLRTYIMGTLANMVEDIASGCVEPNPYTRGSSHDACSFCPYSSICHRNTVEGRRNYKTMEQDRFWQEVEKEVDRRG